MSRSISRVVPGIRTLEGAGFAVRRPFPTQLLEDFDPFLLLDQLGPTDYAPGEAKGAPNHPHRGFETVTYQLEGVSRHKDSAGNAGELGPGDVQWMTAGAGVVHDEVPAPAFLKTGGRMHGFQLWVNLPRKDKLIPPRYQELKAGSIPVAQKGGIRVKVIAGEAMGVRAATETRTPMFYLHYTLEPGASVVQRAPADHNTFAWIISGEGRFGNGEGTPAREGEMVIFERDGDEVELRAETKLDLLLIGGVPIGEPVVRYGPFVMNTEKEIVEAFQDYQSGRMGQLR